MTASKAIDACLVVGGPYHDMDFARLELLKLLAEHEQVRVRVCEAYDAEIISSADLLLTYTCDCMPDEDAQVALQAYLARGGRWFALHGTNSSMVLRGEDKVECPPLPEKMRRMLGSQFLAHPRPGRYKVKNVAPSHPLVDGIGTFFVEDEQYLQDHDPENVPLLVTRFGGETPLFERTQWEEADHQVMYLRDVGEGAVLYLTLGHARGRYDMRPLAEFYPLVERGSWMHPVFLELLRRGICWALNRERVQ